MWFTVTKAVQVTKRVVIDDIIATRIVGGLVAAKRRIKTRLAQDANVRFRSQLKRGHVLDREALSTANRLGFPRGRRR